MSKKGKKTKPGRTTPAPRGPEGEDQPAVRKDQRSEIKDQLPELKAQFAEIESKWLEMTDRTWLRCAAVIVGLATFLRLVVLTLRPVHHDEGVNGWMLTNLLRDNVYKYDPSNYHGPTLYYIAFPLIKLFGLETIPIRFSIVVFGVLMVILVLLLRRYLGDIGTLLAAFFVAITPGMVFVSRYFIHEILFVFLSLAIVVSILLFIERRKAGPFAIGWMALFLLVCFLPGALLLGGFLGGDNPTTVAVLRVVFFAVDAAIVYYLMRFLVKWDEGRPIYFLLAAASVSLYFGTKETAFIALGTMAIACVCIWIWEKIGPGKGITQNFYRYILIGHGLAVAAALYYHQAVADAAKWFYTEHLNNSYRAQEPFFFYSVILFLIVFLVTWIIFLIDLKNNTNDSSFEQPSWLSWQNFREAFGDKKNTAIIIAAAFIFFSYLIVLFFSSFFSYKEGVWKAFEAYAIWTKTGTKEHAQNGIFAYLKWGFKGESLILLGSLIGSLVAFFKAKHKFAMFCALWAAGVFAAYMIIPYKTPWLALSYILPMCLIAGYGLGEFIKSNNRRLNISAYALLAVGTVVLSYQTYQLNFVRYDDDQMPYVYAHTRRGFVDMINQIDYYATKSGKGKDAVIDVTSPDYWPMTWYVVNYNHVGYHGHIVDTQAEVVVTKKKDQDTEALAKYADKYKYVGEYPLRPGVDLNLLVRNDIADPPCSGNVQDGVQKGQGVVIYNTEHCSRELSVIPSIPATP